MRGFIGVSGGIAWLVGVLVVSVGLVGCAIGAAEGQVVEDSFVVNSSPRLLASIDNGSIEVVSQGDGAGNIQVRATVRNPGRVEYEVFQEGDTVKIEAKADTGMTLPWGETPGLSIVVSVPVEIDLELETSNGSVRVSGVSGQVLAKTSNGNVSLSSVTGDVRAEASNGRLELEDLRGQVTAETSNGGIDFRGALRPGSQNVLKTSNGSVSVTLVDTSGVELDAAASNGRVGATRPVALAGPARENELVGTIGDGGSRLEIRTSNGSISVN
jgi:hypothetical protein